MLNVYQVLDIKEQEIYTKYPCSISINKKEYKDFISEEENKFVIPGIIEIYFPEYEDYTQIVTNYNSINVLKSNNYTEDNEFITIYYVEDDKIIEQEFVDSSVGLPVIRQMLNGKFKYIKSPEIMINLLHGVLPASDLIHLEVIMSNIFRDEKTGEPCRFTDYNDATQYGMLQLGKSDSWLSAIAFQHLDQGIMKGLVAQKPAKMNPIEKVLNEEFQDL